MSDRQIDSQQMVAAQWAATQILAPCNIAWLAQILLCGSALSLFFTYLHTDGSKSDPPKIRVLVWTITAINVASTIIGWVESFHYSVSQARDLASISGFTTADCIAQLPQGLVTMLAQTFLASRAIRLLASQKSRQIAFWALVAFIQMGFFAVIASTVLSFKERYGEVGSFTSSSAAGIWLYLSAFVDIATSVLLYLKLKAQILGEHAATDGIIFKLMRLGVLTALPTTILAIWGATLCAIRTSTNWVIGDYNIIFISPLPSVYVLVVIGTLLIRARLRAELRNCSGPRSSTQGPVGRTAKSGQFGLTVASGTPIFPLKVAVDKAAGHDLELQTHRSLHFANGHEKARGSEDSV